MKPPSPSALTRALWTRSERTLVAVTSATLLAGVVSAPVVARATPVAAPATVSCTVACGSEGSPAARVPTAEPSARPSASAPSRPAARTVRPKPTKSPTPRVAAPKPTPRPLVATRLKLSVPAGVDRATAAAIREMRLTPEGYLAFLRGIDRSYFAYAQQFPEFDPDRVPIEQGRSKVFVWHFTAFYRNADGPSQTPRGRMTIHPFIEGLAERGDEQGDHVCCGVNWLIDRDGPTHQLAPLNAKLRHNPPYDSINTGVEIEAARQGDITTKQYESAAYLTIAVLDSQHLLGRRPLAEIAKGHGEMRDAYLEGNPHSHWGSRSDFDAPESRMLRQVIQSFLTAHPQVVAMHPRLR